MTSKCSHWQAGLQSIVRSLNSQLMVLDTWDALLSFSKELS